MAGDFDFDISDVMKNLDLTADEMNKAANAALKESIDPLQKQIETITNRSDGTSSTHKKYPDQGHAQDDVEVSGIRGGATDNKHIDVGFSKTNWRMYFVDLGTIKQPPQHIIDRSIVLKRDEVLQIQAEVLKRGLGL